MPARCAGARGRSPLPERRARCAGGILGAMTRRIALVITVGVVTAATAATLGPTLQGAHADKRRGASPVVRVPLAMRGQVQQLLQELRSIGSPLRQVQPAGPGLPRTANRRHSACYAVGGSVCSAPSCRRFAASLSAVPQGAVAPGAPHYPTHLHQPGQSATVEAAAGADAVTSARPARRPSARTARADRTLRREPAARRPPGRGRVTVRGHTPRRIRRSRSVRARAWAYVDHAGDESGSIRVAASAAETSAPTSPARW